MKNLSKFGIIDKLPYGILNLSSDFKIEYVNQYAASVLKIDDSQDKFNIFSQIWVDKFGNPIADGEHPIELCFKTKNQTNDVILGISAGNDDTFNWINSHFIPEFDNSKKLISLCFTFNKIEPTNHNQIEDEKIYKSMFESNPQPMWIYDQETLEFLDVNNSAISHYGYNRDEFLKMTILDIRPETEIKKLIDDIRNTNLDLNYAGNWLHRKKNGDIIEVEIISKFIYIQGRKARHVLINDITDRKIAEQKKHEAEILFRTLVKKSSEAIFIVNEHGRPVFVSHTSIKMLGYSEEEVRSMQFRDVVHPDDLDSIENTFRKVLEFPESEVKLFGRQRQKSGSYIWCEGSATNWLDDPYIKGIVVNFRDVTDRIQKEEFLQKRNELLKQMSKIAKIGGWEFDCSTMKQEWTDETYVIHDLDKESYNPNAQEELSRFEPGSKEKIEKAFELAFNQGEPYDLEVEMTTVKGNRKWVRAVCSPILNEGKVVKLAGTVQDITVHKKVEIELMQSNIRFVTMFRSNPTPSGITRASDFRIFDVNDAWCKLTGYSREEVLNLNSTDLGIAKPEILNQIRENLFKHKSIQQTEILIYTRSGEERIVLLNSEIIEVGGEKYILNNLIDITDRKIAENNLSILADRLNLATQSAGMGTWDWDIQKNTIVWDSQMYKLYGLENQEFGGAYEAWLNGLHPEDREMSNQITQNALLGNKNYNTEFRVLWPDNSIHWLKADGVVIKDENGKPVRMLGVNYDITERKVAEEKLKENQTLLTQIIDSEPDSIFAIDLNYCLLLNNKRHQQVLIDTGGKLLQKGDSILPIEYPEEVLDYWKGLYNKAIAGEKFKMEMEWQYKDGILHTIETYFSPLFDSKGIIFGALVVIHDITDKKLSEKLIRESEERYRKLAENFPDTTITFYDKKLKVTFVTGQELIKSKRSTLEFIGKSPEEILTPTLAKTASESFKKAFAGEINSFESESFDGRILKVISVPIVEQNGEINEIQVISQNITEQKKIENERLISNEKYSKLFNSSGTPTIIFKLPDGIISEVNQKFLTLTGFYLDELIGRTSVEVGLVKPEKRSKILEIVNLNESLIDYELEINTKNGEKKFVLVNTVQLNFDIESYLITTWFDITDRKNAEISIRESEERFRNLFERMTQGVVYQNSDGYITAANDSALEMLGLSLDQLQGRTSFTPEWKAIKGDGSEFPGNEHPAMITLSTGKPMKDVIMGVYHPLDESYKWLLIHTTPVFKNNSSKPIAVFAIFDDITSKRKAEIDKRESELLFKTIFNNFNSNVFILDKSGRILKINDTIINKYNIDKLEIEGKIIQDLPWWKNNEYDYSDFILQAIKKAVNGESVRNELSFYDKMKQKLYFEISVIPIRYEKAEINQILFESRDTTELRNQEESARILNRMFQKSASGVVIADARQNDFPIVDVNDAFTSITGYDKLEVIGKNCRFLQGEDRDIYNSNLIRNAIKEGKECRVEVRNFKKTGELFWNELYLAPVHNNLGQLTHYVGIQNDITTKKQEHDELENYRHRLEEIVDLRTQELKFNQEKLLKTQKMVKLGSWEFDFKTQIPTWTDELYNIFERNKNLLPYTLPEFIETVFEEDKNIFFDFMELTKSAKQVNSKTLRHLTELKKLVYLEHNVETEFENNQPIKIIGSIQDVTKQKLTELELNKAVKDAEVANKSKSEFLANMSHEIRTPLNSIIGFSELLYNQVKDEKSRSQLETIRKSGKTLLKIINDILDLSKVEAGKIVIENEPIDIFLLTKDVVQMFEQSLKEKKLILYIELLTDLNTRVMLDETRLRQILFNLVGNAIKFTHIGRIEILINHIEKNNGNIDLFIKINDTGIGIPKDQLSSIFEPFVQQQGQILKKFGGTGLGLAISKRMIEALGGRIEVQSEPNKGSEFTITLCNVVTINSILENSKSTKLLDSSIKFDNSRILIVDDIPENRNLLIDLLEPTGITIFETDNGLDAINLANDKNPDIILMDIRMPGIDGIETTRILKQSSKTSKIPCIAVTASVMYGPNDNWIDELFTEYLTKPIDIEKLFILLSKYLHPTIISDNRLHILDQTDSENIGLTEEKINITDIKLKQLLIDELEPEFKKVSGSHLIDEIEDFGKKLILIGTENQNEFLKGLGKNICSYVELFDIDKINKSLNEFNKLMDKIKV